MRTILLTDVPELPPDERCPVCHAGKESRVLSQTFGPLHDVCRVCGHQFDVLTVPLSDEHDEGDE